jgi:hypothetical protein
MTKAIWKFQIHPEHTPQPLMLPAEAEILCINEIMGETMLHVLVPNSPDVKNVRRLLHCIPTGQPIHDDNLRYVDTVLYRGGLLVFHYFEERQP